MFESRTKPLMERIISVRGGYLSRITDLGNQLGKLQAEVKNKEEIISRQLSQVLQLENDVNDLRNKLDLATNEIIQLGRDKGNLAIEVEQLKVQIESLKLGSGQGLTGDSTLRQFIKWVKDLFWRN